MNAPLLYVGGSKGGVGKSNMSFALIDYFLEQQKPVLLFETDTSNPDVFKAHYEHEDLGIICSQTDLDTADGWIELINLADEFPNHIGIVNSAARSNTGITKYGETLRETLPELDRNLITFWMINQQRDSLELLRGFLNSFPDANIHVCRNLIFGEPDQFDLYNQSKTKEIIESRGSTLDFPVLAKRVANKLYSERKPIKMALSELRLGDRAELKRWRSKCAEIFKNILRVDEYGPSTN